MMQEGLLWFDNDPNRRLVVKVRQAATRYQAKFGRQPTVCYLNQADWENHPPEINGIRLQTSAGMLRHHLWIGVDDDRPLARAA